MPLHVLDSLTSPLKELYGEISTEVFKNIVSILPQNLYQIYNLLASEFAYESTKSRLNILAGLRGTLAGGLLYLYSF